jgi:hypothetical protein
MLSFMICSKIERIFINVPATLEAPGNVTETYIGGFDMVSLTQKRCSTCGEWKDKSEFHKNKNYRDGREYACKSCRSATARRYLALNPEQEHARKKRWADKNKEKTREKDREWRAKNPEKVKAWKQKNYYKDPEKARERSHNWKASNKEKLREYYRSYREKNLEQTILWTHQRRARIKGNGGTFTVKQWRDLCEKYGNKCLRCGRTDQKLTIDHVIPIVLGGLNVIENIQPLCRSCNCKKNKKHIDYRGSEA